jgi:hypothetical protein
MLTTIVSSGAANLLSSTISVKRWVFRHHFFCFRYSVGNQKLLLLCYGQKLILTAIILPPWKLFLLSCHYSSAFLNSCIVKSHISSFMQECRLWFTTRWKLMVLWIVICYFCFCTMVVKCELWFQFLDKVCELRFWFKTDFNFWCWAAPFITLLNWTSPFTNLSTWHLTGSDMKFHL